MRCTSRSVVLLCSLALSCSGNIEQVERDAGHPADGALVWQGESGSCSVPCGASCCGDEQLCLDGDCQDLGEVCDELWPCPENYFCDTELGRCIPGARRCEYRPPVGDFTPELEWEWTGSQTLPEYNQVMMTPMVASLTDDNGDGAIDRQDTPDIVFNTFTGGNYQSDGVLRVISGDGSGEHFTVSAPAHRTLPGREVALGDLDGDGIPEIVACASDGGLIAFEHDGTFKWRSDPTLPCGGPVIANLDGQGNPEVLSGCNALEGASGELRWQSAVDCGTYVTAADLDEDGTLEVVSANAVLDHLGQLRWQKETAAGHVAVADLDLDGKPEVIATVASEHALYAYRQDGELYFGPLDINQGQADLQDKCQGCGGGPPTVANFDDDAYPEIAAAAGYGYVIFEHDGTPKWFKKTQDLSSRATGSSVFDFEGDGKAEVVYADELELRIYSGESGAVLFSTCNTSGTLAEYPLIVDVDNDDHAEIVVANNNYAFTTCADGSPSHTGIRVLGDAKNNWVRTRRIWNQHTYHVTNVDEDGLIPAVEARNWDNPALNNFRQNVQPGGLFDAPDLLGEPGPAASCSGVIRAAVVVKNEGAARVVAGLEVALFAQLADATPLLLGNAQTQGALLPGQSEVVFFEVLTPVELAGQAIVLFARVDDDGAGGSRHNECDEENNQVELGEVQCQVIE